METIAETLPGVDVPVWFGILGPRGMPANVVQFLNSHFTAIMQMPDVQARVRELNVEPTTSTPEEMRTAIRGRVAERHRQQLGARTQGNQLTRKMAGRTSAEGCHAQAVGPGVLGLGKLQELRHVPRGNCGFTTSTNASLPR